MEPFLLTMLAAGNRHGYGLRQVAVAVRQSMKELEPTAPLSQMRSLEAVVGSALHAGASRRAPG